MRRGKDKRSRGSRADRAEAHARRLAREADAARAAQGQQGAPSTPSAPPTQPHAPVPNASQNAGTATEGPVSVPPTDSSEPKGAAPASGSTDAGAVPLPSDLKSPDDVARWLAMLFAFPAATLHRAWSLTDEHGNPTPRAQAAAVNLWPVIQKYGIGKGLTEYFPEMMAIHAIGTLLQPVYQPTVAVLMGEEPSEIERAIVDLARRNEEKKKREAAEAEAAARAAAAQQQPAAGAVITMTPRPDEARTEMNPQQQATA